MAAWRCAIGRACVAGVAQEISRLEATIMVTRTLAAALLVACLVTVAAGCGGGGGDPAGGGGTGTNLVVTTAALANATVGSPYSSTIVATGGTAPYSFALTSTAVPGLSLSATSGVLSGTPTLQGSYTVAVQVSDVSSPVKVVSKTFTLTVNAAAVAGVTITTQSLPTATVNQSYSSVILSSGGTPPYSYLLTATTAPGMSLQSVGVLSGTPTVQGNFSMTVRVTDSSFPQQQFTKSFPFVVNPVGGGGGSSLAITTTTAPAGKVGDAYSASIAATGGTQPYTFTQTSAAIPGLTFSANGTLTGTPQIDGTFVWQVQVTDSATPVATQVATFNIVVSPLSATEALSQQTTFASAEAQHLIGRVAWGAAAGQADAAAAMGLVAYVDSLLNVTTDTAIENAAALDQLGSAIPSTIDTPIFPNRNQVAQYWLQIMSRTNNPLQETMAFFWHDLFATSTENLAAENMYWAVWHINMLRRNALGNVRTHVKEVGKDWLMLDWLDGIRSTKTAPNENYARELWELFTLGADNGYTQADIIEAAKCFTGWRLRVFTNTTGGPNHYYIDWDANRHHVGNKTFFGQTITGKTGVAGQQEYDEVVDITFDNRPVAEFMVKRLWEYFCYESPSQEIIDMLAAQLRTANYEIKPVLRTILLSKAFYSDKSKGTAVEVNGGIVKMPLEFAIGFIRSTGLEIPMTTLRGALANAGQLPSSPPNVNGWPTGALWASADGLIARSNIIRDAITNRTYQTGLGITLDPILPPVGQRTDTAVVDRLAASFGINMTITERQRYIDYLNTDQATTTSLPVSNPFNGNDATQIDKKVRGLLYIMAQHPSFHIR